MKKSLYLLKTGERWANILKPNKLLVYRSVNELGYKSIK